MPQHIRPLSFPYLLYVRKNKYKSVNVICKFLIYCNCNFLITSSSTTPHHRYLVNLKLCIIFNNARPFFRTLILNQLHFFHSLSNDSKVTFIVKCISRKSACLLNIFVLKVSSSKEIIIMDEDLCISWHYE
jgi:hypothetical protein